MRCRQIFGVVAALLAAGHAAAGPARADRGAARSPILPALRLEQTGGAGGGAPDEASLTFASRKRYILPVLLSALVPGAGEIYTGHWLRGAPLVAADAATWYGYSHYQGEGKNWRTRYELFANAHWDSTRWRGNLKRYQPNWSDTTDVDGCTCKFISRDEDRQHYYENIGKYAYYWGGWEDWHYKPDFPYESDSDHLRRQYDDLRIESNHNFDHSTEMLYVAMGTRFLSVIQSIYLVHQDGRDGGLSFRTWPVRGRGAGIELTLRR